MFPPSPADALAGARCARHFEAPAVAVCSRCGSFTCAQCQRVDRDGRPWCPACFRPVALPAERSARFWANLVDSFAWWLPLFPCVILAVGSSKDGDDSSGLLLAAALLLGVAGMTGVLCYQAFLSSKSGQSIGKRMMGIRVVRSDGSPVSLGRIIFLRNVVPLAIGNFCGVFSIADACAIYGKESRCLHDLIADTRVVVAPRSDGWDRG